MFDPDGWLRRGVHWHAYVEVRDADMVGHSTREHRLTETPAAVFRAPDDVAEWVAAMTRKHAHPERVRLIGPPAVGDGHVGDDGHVEHDFAANLDVLGRGDSLYLDFARESDRLHLWVEAVTADDCPEVHNHQE
ncbi:hypothetical protein AB0L13_16535 [Saccharopolyspora shandongensis]|uniref:hypothetical protein n=1 Tax=Saccharopolyspora shandongensis TaxID=418495 RepID=UPI0034399B7B